MSVPSVLAKGCALDLSLVGSKVASLDPLHQRRPPAPTPPSAKPAMGLHQHGRHSVSPFTQGNALPNITIGNQSKDADAACVRTQSAERINVSPASRGQHLNGVAVDLAKRYNAQHSQSQLGAAVYGTHLCQSTSETSVREAELIRQAIHLNRLKALPTNAFGELEHEPTDADDVVDKSQVDLPSRDPTADNLSGSSGSPCSDCDEQDECPQMADGSTAERIQVPPGTGSSVQSRKKRKGKRKKANKSLGNSLRRKPSARVRLKSAKVHQPLPDEPVSVVCSVKEGNGTGPEARTRRRPVTYSAHAMQAFCSPMKVLPCPPKTNRLAAQYSKDVNGKAAATRISHSSSISSQVAQAFLAATVISQGPPPERSAAGAASSTSILRISPRKNCLDCSPRKSYDPGGEAKRCPVAYRVSKVYLSEKQSGMLKELGLEVPCAPPVTPMPDMLRQYDYVPCMNDVKAQRSVKVKLEYMERVEKKKQDKLKEEKQRKEKVDMKQKEVVLRRRQRLEIYALNRVMTGLEHQNFDEYCRVNGLTCRK